MIKSAWVPRAETAATTATYAVWQLVLHNTPASSRCWATIRWAAGDLPPSMSKKPETREIRTPSLLIWSQTRCHCGIAPWSAFSFWLRVPNAALPCLRLHNTFRILGSSGHLQCAIHRPPCRRHARSTLLASVFRRLRRDVGEVG